MRICFEFVDAASIEARTAIGRRLGYTKRTQQFMRKSKQLGCRH